MYTNGAWTVLPSYCRTLPILNDDSYPPSCPPPSDPIDWYSPVPDLPPQPDLPAPPDVPIDFNGPPAAPQTAAGPSDSSDAVARRMLAVADVDGDGTITRQDTRGGLGADVTRDQLQLARRLLAIADRGAAGARDGVVTLADVRGLTDEQAGKDRTFSNLEFEHLLRRVEATGLSALAIRFPTAPPTGPANKR